MNDPGRTPELAAADARRTQRRSDAVVAQYLHELSDRHRRQATPTGPGEGRGSDHAAEARTR